MQRRLNAVVVRIPVRAWSFNIYRKTIPLLKNIGFEALTSAIYKKDSKPIARSSKKIARPLC